MIGARRTRLAPKALVISLAGLLGAALASCAVAPPIEGAPCPCPGGYVCDDSRGVCVAGKVPGNPMDTPTPGSEKPGNPPPPVAAPPANICTEIGAPRPTRLSSLEYRFTVADLLGVALTATELPPDVPDPNTGFVAPSADADVERALRELSKVVVARARPGLQRPPECAASLSDDACGRLFVDSFGQRAFRRPLDEADRTALTAAFTGGQRNGGLVSGMAAVIEAALASDNFLLRRELPADPTARGRAVKADAWTIASRLGALLWRSSPDEPLLAAARTGDLLQTAEIEKQVARMLLDPRGARMLTTFFRDWLDVDGDRLVVPDPALPDYSASLRNGILQSFDGFAARVQGQDAPLASLLTAPETLADPALASFYGLNPPVGPGFQPVLPRDQQIRRGLLTSPGFLAAHANPDQSNPVKRGLAIMRDLLCTELPPPAGNVPLVPEANPALTTRARFLEHSVNPACSVCHQLLDPLGFGLENYDGVGRWRTVEGGTAIDASGRMPVVTDVSNSFVGPAEMTDTLTRTSQVQSCYVQQWFRFAFGRPTAAGDMCLIDRLAKAFTAGQGRTRALLTGIATSEAFTSLDLFGK
jgi:hypothetical protein